MDFTHRPGAKTGSGPLASWSEENAARKERFKKIAFESVDLANDPYLMKNHLGSYECKLCLTIHMNEGSYLVHTQGKKHQTNLARRQAREARDGNTMVKTTGLVTAPKKTIVKIGRPGYKVTKIRDPITKKFGLLFQIKYPEIAPKVTPKYRFMSSFEQKVEAPDRHFQYVLFAAEPYETIAFKVPSVEIDTTEEKMLSNWDPDSKQFTFQVLYKDDVLPVMIPQPGMINPY
ncbi:splicing factor 3A subunit 2 [Rozella allomycis CSF55]|uniref:Splicing factor 3A subunit 2 n=1 Tax=Rozella allomycis (strain CSF55) TaxID=988480 RepID=A0A075AR31_ROZAC|nr:hypothetical protein O9G_000768 [Rozella allomycis CSF55]RKP19212.1 splicing factor 3A subunit 2 [Rozella allomycis CSF55]|eukprot:EPZ32693.1 hypothetical protein O9G_000768 [Rozella allomycis CSF55]